MCRCNPILTGSEAWLRQFVVHYWDVELNEMRDAVYGDVHEAKDAFERIVKEGHNNVVLNEEMYCRLECNFESFKNYDLTDSPMRIKRHDIEEIEGFKFSVMTPQFRELFLVTKDGRSAYVSGANLNLTLEGFHQDDVLSLMEVLKVHGERLRAKALSIVEEHGRV